MKTTFEHSPEADQEENLSPLSEITPQSPEELEEYDDIQLFDRAFALGERTNRTHRYEGLEIVDAYPELHGILVRRAIGEPPSHRERALLMDEDVIRRRESIPPIREAYNLIEDEAGDTRMTKHLFRSGSNRTDGFLSHREGEHEPVTEEEERHIHQRLVDCNLKLQELFDLSMES